MSEQLTVYERTRQRLADANARIAELEAQLAAATQWQPVTAHYQDGNGIVQMTFRDNMVGLLIRGHGLINVQLRADDRLCRRVVAPE